jgi:predicted enzyme related to lactoylglutathione lyase
MGNPVTHFEINGSDGKRLQKYYADLFGWKVVASNPLEYGLVDTETGRGANGGISGSETGPSVTFYVEVNDPQAYLDKAVELGGKVITPVTTIPQMVIMAQFADPEGNVIGIISDQMPE